MKLHEFDYIDNFNLSYTELCYILDALLKSISQKRDWGDYTFRQRRPVETLESGAKLYGFEVISVCGEKDTLDQ